MHVQAIRVHSNWLRQLPVAGNSNMDIYAAFSRGDEAFSVPMVLEGRSRQVPLRSLLQHDVVALYVQTMVRLADFEPRTCRPDDPLGHAFAIAAGQSFAVFIALLETPRFAVQASEEYLMRDAESQHEVSNQDLLRRLLVTQQPPPHPILGPGGSTKTSAWRCLMQTH